MAAGADCPAFHKAQTKALERKKKKHGILRMHFDTLTICFEFCSVGDRLRCRAVNSAWRTVLQRPLLWPNQLSGSNVAALCARIGTVLPRELSAALSGRPATALQVRYLLYVSGLHRTPLSASAETQRQGHHVCSTSPRAPRSPRSWNSATYPAHDHPLFRCNDGVEAVREGLASRFNLFALSETTLKALLTPTGLLALRQRCAYTDLSTLPSSALHPITSERGLTALASGLLSWDFVLHYHCTLPLLLGDKSWQLLQDGLMPAEVELEDLLDDPSRGPKELQRMIESMQTPLHSQSQTSNSLPLLERQPEVCWGANLSWGSTWGSL
eukprot:TRINITY_DN94726_c0_g1_i1.p1 TRINITY_DN94726_c0_g1~~TRINITY_DN94726_c0_g1_i1.p1  ORF type:complete len:334 (+),score=11.73 TRINITY_DN94726_c0_g1_i1:24-1004(+)